ncbi:DUF4139 domain-containing protein [Alteraurantiacibacter buctensis]|uniref:DUF4139 domain-containing protein n=1 Tax=Alteraurantiacibacter buctensis TaxID=1503981 RepID=A0A844YWX8_9SPHN|nr:hypothetical protein [Alteraurantiacibacter buctensis]MXO71478.1 hypothetical protein [Alteraurantiacibacter buctensis]
MPLRLTPLLAVPLLLAALPALAQERATVDASEPTGLAVTVYRDPNRGEGGQMDRNWPRGFAMISETRQVTLPPGESTIRFEGVAEGMVAVSAIVTGLPGGTIEKNRNADLLSPAALVDGTLGNRVTVRRTNPATGAQEVQSAIVRTRADGGLVLQTDQGFEAVRCAGVPERLEFTRVPEGLSAQPVYSINTRDDRGGIYTVTLTYLAWGFDWQANYVATLADGGTGDEVSLRLLSWLTILNDNNQAFPDAELMAVAGTLEVVSDFQGLADPPDARPLQLTCYPLGSTATGSPVPDFSGGLADALGYGRYPGAPPPPPPPAPMMMRMASEESAIVVTGARVAEQEQLGDLKLYRFPEAVTVSAKGLKQVAFLDQQEVRGRFVYRARCTGGYDDYTEVYDGDEPQPRQTELFLATRNDEEHGLGMPLPSGSLAVFEPSSAGELLVAAPSMRDHAEGQEVELALGYSPQVLAACELTSRNDPNDGPWAQMRATLTNANDAPITARILMGSPAEWDIRGQRTTVKDGQRIAEVTVPVNGRRVITWQVRQAGQGGR